ncbi:phage shock protein C (PspC) family protein [Mucilaginibacter pineti]|uniref:Phage shock protein C (PspC) family protein n=1 Tax=Mucilaginibacter pineti TaxID=1391627 RepID=A0A1G7MMU4_9SPHI|nr:PspC domain-containing protein [Mucilaginibacter pineti]SDF63102.1 phage shock protein C (PspC) family protein [Mucilaginibacter pineti]
MEKKLYRDEHRKVIGGVCAGLADYFDADIAIIRAIFLITLFVGGSSFLVYLVLWVVLPKKGYNFFNPGVDYRVPNQDPFNPFSSTPPQQPFGFDQMPPKKKSNTGLFIGVILILIGASFLLHELRLFAFLHLGRLWPAVIVFAGLALIVSGQKKKPWEEDNWNADASQAPAADDTVKKEATFTQDDNLKDTTPPTI